jgi:hypothetical protein
MPIKGFTRDKTLDERPRLIASTIMIIGGLEIIERFCQRVQGREMIRLMEKDEQF